VSARDSLVDITKGFVAASRRVVAEDKAAATDDNPFDQVSGTPALDALKINDEELTEEQLQQLLDKIEAAKSDPEMWKALTNVLGVALKGLVLLLSLLMLVTLTGCTSTPVEIREAMQIEKKAFGVFKSDHDIIVKAYHADLTLALDRQVEIIMKYELKAAGNDEAKKARIIEQAGVKRAELRKRLDQHMMNVKQADNNYLIALKIHAAVERYLAQEFDSAAMVGTAEAALQAVEAVTSSD
jgi:hypothetical protein